MNLREEPMGKRVLIAYPSLLVLVFLGIVHGHKTCMGFIVDFTVTFFFFKKGFLFLCLFFYFKQITQKYFFTVSSHGVELCTESIEDVT